MALILLALGACGFQPVVQPATRGAELYDVVVVGANGDRNLASLVVLEVIPSRDGTRGFATIRSEGTWEEGGRELAFDSDAPTPADPWFLRMQHMVASIPATVQLDASGAPVAVRDEEQWRSAARELIYGADLPVQALQIGESLLDPEGLVRDLRRDFPGTPVDGEWVRSERLAGVEAERVETCTVEEARASTTWTCTGHADGPKEGPARLHEVTTRTEIEADRRGLVRLESTWSGTLVLLGQEHEDVAGSPVMDRPIAERRLVQRR